MLFNFCNRKLQIIRRVEYFDGGCYSIMENLHMTTIAAFHPGIFYRNKDHVFYKCDYARQVWKWFGDWAGLINREFSSFEMMCDYIKDLTASKKNRKLIMSLCYVLLWSIWKERNERQFGERVKKPLQLADDIQLSSFKWVKNRGKMGKMIWAEWCCRPTVSD
ncbi:hypothetical protein LXL04_022724 [Taraxacum kok-saghyz]